MKLLTAFDTPEEARLFLLYLESYEIIAEIRDDATIAAYPLAAYALGGVKIFVREEHFSQAQELLIQYEKGPIEDSNIQVLEGEVHDEDIELLEAAEQSVAKNRILQQCPKCESRQLSRPKLLLFPLIFIVGILVGLFLKRWGWVLAGLMWWSSFTYLPSIKCKRCGYKG